MNESEIFNAAVKLSVDERAKFLNLACEDNAALRSQVEGLLKAHFDSQSFLENAEQDLAQRRGDAEGRTNPQSSLAPTSRQNSRAPQSSLSPASGERVG